MSAREPSRGVVLFGTDEPVAEIIRLTAGSLAADLVDGNLRAIKWNGVEMIRAVAFILRDRDWGTYAPAFSDLKVETKAGGFRVRYRATAADATQSFSYTALIAGEATGELSFACEGSADTRFRTNRTGFVVLHPIEGVAGEAVTLEHCDGSVVETRFPLAIDPVQPFRNLRAMSHAFAPGRRVVCRMEGDAFETEDQRNWTDASYKTYVRPLALPWPYDLAPGERLSQSVVLTVSEDASGEPASTIAGRSTAPRSSDTARLVVGAASTRTLPRLGLGLQAKDLASAEGAARRIAESGAAHILCRYDPGAGDDARSLGRAVDIARAAGAAAWLEFVVPTVDRFEGDIAEAGRLAEALGAPFDTVFLSPAADLKSTLPGSVWPPAPPLDAVYRAARRAFPQARIGGGMFSFFTELNRKRPPLDAIDLITFSTSAVVHAGDDASVMESLESLPSIARSARLICGDLPFHVGPSGIGMRLNPYGDAPKDNPDNIRLAMSAADPRQRGLFGAAWALGYVDAFATGGAAALTLGDAVGPFGLVHVPGKSKRPFFDAGGADAIGRLHPVFHVFRGVARLSGRPMLDLSIEGAASLVGIGCSTAEGREIWIANLSDDERVLDVSALAGEALRGAVLDDAAFAESTRSAALLDALLDLPAETPIALHAYTVLRLVQERSGSYSRG